MGIFFKSTKQIPRPVLRIRRIVIVIFIVGIFAALLDYPKAWDRASDFLNPKIDKISALRKINIPHFKQIPFKLGLDLQGGAHLIYSADVSAIKEKERREAMEGVRDVIERRINLFGVAEPVVQINKSGNDYRLIVELAGVNIRQAINMIGETPFLEFKEELSPEKGNQILERLIPEQYKQGVTADTLCPNAEALKLFILQFGQDPCFVPSGLKGTHLKRGYVDFDQNTSRPYTGLEFTDEGKNLFKEITSRNIKKKLAIYLDGVPISIPTVQETITGGSAQITGNFTVEEVKQLVRRLNAGALPVPIKLISQQSVEASLGSVSLTKSLKAGLYGFLFVVLFMVVFYRFRGIVASIALVLYAIFILALFKLIGVTLTLSGIAGLILSIGMAVDANVLIFARIREELKSGKSEEYSTDEGFKRAWPSIRDGHVSTLISCFILYIFTSGPIKGFALTLGIGDLMSIFSAVVVTRLLLKIKFKT